MGIREALLTVLATGPQHGYQLKLDLEAATGEVWTINVAQIYSTLSRLERDGLVTAEPEDDEGRIRYAITDAGEAEARTWLTTAEDRTSPARDELSMKLLLALVAGITSVDRVIATQRDATLRALQDYTRLKIDADGDGDLAWQLQIERLAITAEAELKWLDRVESRLDGLPAGTTAGSSTWTISTPSAATTPGGPS